MKRLVVFFIALAGCSSARLGAMPTCSANLAAGDLTITEIMADPAGADTGKEWFEVKNNRSSSFDLAGLVLTAAKPDGTSPLTHTVTHQTIAAGGYVVFGGAAPMPKPTFVDYDYGNDLGALRNDTGLLSLKCGSVTVDQTVYNAPVEGASLQKDSAGTWCDSLVEYDTGDKGSPGKANARCPAAPSSSTCDDGGTTRPIDPPGPGDLVISEIMPNPNKVSDESGEWFEVTVTRDLDTNGLQIGTVPGTVATTVSSGECLHHKAGTQVLYARSSDPAVNGGLPAVEATFSFGLSNSTGTIWVGAGGVLLDQVSWTRSFDGASLSLDPGSLDPLANDNELNFCAGQSTFGDGDKGTPGAPNDSCGGTVPTGQCMDNGVQRNVRAPAAGDLIINEYLADPAGADAGKEWFEVYVKNTVDLNGLQLGTTFPTVAQTLNSPSCISVNAGQYLVFAHNDGASDDGGLPREDFQFTFDLINANRGIFLGFNGALVDAVTYANLTTGAAHSLDPRRLDASANDDDANWCDVTTPYGDGSDGGTPGSPNGFCPSGPGCLDNGNMRDVVSPGPGDVVITELMPDPSAVGDEEGEWFEILLKKDADLNGLELGTKPGTPALTIADGNCRHRTAGSRLVFARSNDSTMNGGLPAVEETFAFGLSNSGGTLFVGVGGQVLDQVTWTSSSSGVSRSLAPSAEDPIANDADTSWCGATSRYGAGDRGTPGLPNDACGAVVPVGKCMDGGTLRDIVAPKAGDVVIDELLADATGSDTGKEWFELFVAHDVDLNGLEMGTNAGTVLTTVDQTACLHATEGSYLVFAHNDGMSPNGGLPRVDGLFDFSLVNGGGGLFVGYGGAVLDAVTYGAVREGVARSLDPSKTDPTADDDLDNWCDATLPYGDGDKGTPGMANPACPPIVPTGSCLDGATVRPIVAPAVGDVVLTEVMPNPSAVPDTDGEWFEVAVKKDVDLNGLEMGTAVGTPLVTITDPVCHHHAAGSFVVFARGVDPAVNGGLTTVEATFPFALPNSSGSIFIGLGGQLLDKISWSTSDSGKTRSLDANHTDAAQNDFETNWCNGEQHYGPANDLGSPGRQNPVCPIVLQPGQCFDNHHPRDIVPPKAGDLVISEIMQDPTAVGDTDGEWFEITVMADVDLNGITLGAVNGTSVTTITDANCRRRTAGTRLLFAKNDDVTMNGGLSGIEDTFGFSLSNGAGSLQVATADTVVDQVFWTSTTPGRSRSLDPDSLDATANDLDASWCPSTQTYGAGDQGTPGQPNEQCPIVVPPGMCLEADGQTLRPLLTPVLGDLVISEVMADPTKVLDTAGEWFEVTVLHDVDVNGLVAGVTPGSNQMTVAGTACQRRTAGTRMVFAHSTSSDLNGGVTGVEATTFGFSLANGTGGLFIGVDGGDVLDAVTWSAVPSGASLSLDPDKIDPTENDDPSAWCTATMPYGLGDLGSPGQPNEQCPVVLGPGMCFDGGTPRDIAPIAVGDLVISEVMPNPAGSDETTREWFEVTVLHDADLAGLEIGKTNATVIDTVNDGDCHHHAAGDVVLIARPPAAGGDDGGLPAVEASFHFSLLDTNGALFIGRDGNVLDQITWAATTKGESRSLDPGSLDPTLNDTDGNWCLETTTYGPGGAGTPGQPNQVCIPAGMCLDGATLRPINAIQAGDAVVSEIMAGQTDANRDWFEVTLAADRDLNGLQLGGTVGTASSTLGGRACLPHAAGELVFAVSADAGMNGGLPAPDGLVGFTLGATGTIWLGRGGATLDTVTWAAVTEGASRNLDPGKLDPASNDLDASWCPATMVFGDGGLGSPGAPNETCPAVVPMCLDGDGVTMRPIVTPAMGDLLITEVMANPKNSPETGHEWFEVRVANDADLVGLSVASGTHTASFSTTDCQRVAGGTFLVFQNGPADPNDVAHVDYQLPTAFTLTNSASGGATVAVSVSIGGQQYDQALWTTSTDGVSKTLSKTHFDTAGNDVPANFCNSGATLGTEGNKGTPGADDASCP